MKRLEDIAGTEFNKMLGGGGAGSCVQVWKLSDVSGTESIPIFKVFTLKMGTDSVPEFSVKFTGLSAQVGFIER
jgi:hypothetical protein